MTIIIEIREGYLDGRFVRLHIARQHGSPRGDCICEQAH